LLVTAVRPDGPAAREGIQRGDVLLGMHVFETVSLENVMYVIKRPEFTSAQPLKFLLIHNETLYYGYLTAGGSSVRR
jgi:serine protease Do